MLPGMTEIGLVVRIFIFAKFLYKRFSNANACQRNLELTCIPILNNVVHNYVGGKDWIKRVFTLHVALDFVIFFYTKFSTNQVLYPCQNLN